MNEQAGDIRHGSAREDARGGQVHEPASRAADPAVVTDGLTKRYRGRILALDALDLSVPRGCCFGLLGPNGAGKSTLVKTLLSIVRPTDGHARLLGRDIRTTAAREGVGYLPENPRFPRYLSGRGVCRYFGHLAGLRGAELNRQVDEKIALLGMTDRARDKVSRYSKGMNQRVGLAQALVGDPELVFLDEPTDGVDPVGRKQIREVIRQLQRRGTTVFINSHLLAEVEQVCDRIAILVEGRLLREGTVAEVIASLPAARMVTVRFRTRALPGPLAGKPPAELSRTLGLDALGAAELRLEQDELVVALPDPEAIPPAIDRLRAADIPIYAVTTPVLNLEEAFLRLIEQHSSQPAPAPRRSAS